MAAAISGLSALGAAGLVISGFAGTSGGVTWAAGAASSGSGAPSLVESTVI